MTVITAQEARELAGPSVQEHVDAAFVAIRKAANDGKRQLVMRSEFWASGGYNNSAEWKEACAALEAQGFTTVQFCYDERQFVDMYTLIEW